LPSRIAPAAEDRNAARARALRAALQGALRGFGDLVLQRDLAELTGDLRRKKILAAQITELLGRLDDEQVQDAFAAPLGGAYTQGVGGSVASLDKDRIRALAQGFVADAKAGLANTRTLLPFIRSKLLDPAEQDKLREVAMQATAEGLSTKQLAKRLQAPGMPVAARSFPEDGRLWVTFGAKRLPADLYAETLARTTTYHAANRGTLDRCLNDGVELVEVVINPGTIDFCLDLEGKIFALTDAAARRWSVPLLARCPNGGPPFHPNCRHTLAPFEPSDSERGQLPVAPTDALTRQEGRAAQKSAQHAFERRLERDPLPYAEVIAESAARRGYGNRFVKLKGRDAAMAGQPIPGIVGKQQVFGVKGTGALSEDVHLSKRMRDSGIKSRKELRQVAAETLRNAVEAGTAENVLRNQNRLIYHNPASRWVTVVESTSGLVVTAYPLGSEKWIDYQKRWKP